MSTLTEFLLARIDDDERAARGRMQQGEPKYQPTPQYVPSPARVLAECAAKRDAVRILGVDCDDPGNAIRRAWAREALGKFAAVYADHPDYRAEYKP